MAAEAMEVFSPHHAPGLSREAARGHLIRRYLRILPPEIARIAVVLDRGFVSDDAACLRGVVLQFGAVTSSYLARPNPDRCARQALVLALESLSAASIAFDPHGDLRLRCAVAGLVAEVEVFLAIDDGLDAPTLEAQVGASSDWIETAEVKGA